MTLLRHPLKLLGAWIVAHLTIWSIIPWLCNTCLPLDSIEASMWGSEWAWGYDKHPPLSGWTARAAAWALGDLGVYLFAQLCVVIAGVGIYRLGRLFKLEPARALLGVLALDLIFFYQYGAVEYNVNVLQMPCWAWGWYFGIRAAQTRRVGAWIGLGACVALGALTKYIAVFMLVPLAMAWWRRGELGNVLKRPGLYLAGGVSILLFLPHLIWMKNHDWITITYGLSRGATGDWAWWHHLWHPTEFVLAQIAILAPLLLVARFYRKKEETDPAIPGLGALAFGAHLFMAVFALITGMAPVTMWAAPMPLAAGLWLAGRYPIPRRPTPLLATIAVTSLFYLCAYVGVYGLAPRLREKPHRVNYPGPALAAAAEAQWRAQTNAPFRYIVADEWYGGIVNHYGTQTPSVVIHGNFALAPYLQENDVRQHGALVLWLKHRDHTSGREKPIEKEFPTLHEQFKRIEPLPDLIIPWPRRTDGRAGRYGVAFIPAENAP